MKKINSHLLVLFFVCLSLVNCTQSSDSNSSVASEVNSPAAIPPTEEPPETTPPTTTNPPVTSSPPPVVTPPNETTALPLLKGDVQLIVTPNAKGHVEFLQSINSTKSGDVVRMAMFHLTSNEIINALVSAQKRGVTVKVILDSVSLNLPNFNLGFQQLKAGGVDVRASTSAFTISHQKSMVINNSEVFITAINLTKLEDVTRDFGLIVHDPDVISEVISVFEQDWVNANTNQGLTPQVSELHLVWSPVNSLTKLVGLISAAKKTVMVQVENLGDSQIQAALIAAKKRGVLVRVLVPMCSKGNAKANYPYLKELASAGVQTKVMPIPESVTQPYMHSKMMVVDGVIAYVGSVNFSKNSTSRARELGILFSEAKPIQTMSAIFELDWKAAVSVPDETTVSCPLI
ncbi:phospholipase D-like domain-containing protein [Pseudobdellovibrio sp. HCB154]|uniref:phospholipase D-like domain-containing protein n=1 Tax=Pseudobdellovibrio sp. HCB154 TaxID=3386277 RepID=UPI003916DB76